MLIHLAPQIYIPQINIPCVLLDIVCPELSLSLQGESDITVRRPYPNKNYIVACRKTGQRAMNGILVETPERPREFTVTTRWNVGLTFVSTHTVRYVVLDDDYDAISEVMVLWYGTTTDRGGFEHRWPKDHNYGTPATTQPRMELFPSLRREGEVTDKCDSVGALVERNEVFYLHTIQRERILDPHFSFDDRIPRIESAFKPQAVIASEPVATAC